MDQLGPRQVNGWLDRWSDGWTVECMEGRQAEGGRMGGLSDPERQMECEINKNRWEVGQKVALGQEAGGMGGQSIVGGDGSPGGWWRPQQVCAHMKNSKI